MVIVVSDNSPLSVLASLGKLNVLRELFTAVLIPPEVHEELRDPDSPADMKALADSLPDRIRVQMPTTVVEFAGLHAGETAAIALAKELGTVLMIDEKDGRRVARAQGLEIIGAVGVLERAAIAGHLPDFKTVYGRVRAVNFRISDRILAESLARIEMAVSLRTNSSGD